MTNRVDARGESALRQVSAATAFGLQTPGYGARLVYGLVGAEFSGLGPCVSFCTNLRFRIRRAIFCRR